MKRSCQHIRWWIGSMLLLLLSACSGDDATAPVTADAATLLDIGVQTPGLSVLTRAGNIDAIGDENMITSLQIWVFETGTNTLVSYLEPTDFPTTTEDKVYQTNVSSAYANKNPRPNVDVYVLANAASVGLSGNQALTENATRTQLEAAVIGDSYFGPQTTISAEGLPMSGVLRNKALDGKTNKPVLRITSYDNMEKVPLKRAVSKVRFVFCKPSGVDLHIQGVSISANMIPSEEYVFLGTDGRAFRVGSSYNADAISLLDSPMNDIAVCSDPSKYFYTSQDAQEYEDLINSGVSAATPELTPAGPFYFRESNNKVSGTITYNIGLAASSTATFSMQASGDFSRNRSWIVYAYYEGLSGMQINVVEVTPWIETERNHEVYNW